MPDELDDIAREADDARHLGAIYKGFQQRPGDRTKGSAGSSRRALISRRLRPWILALRLRRRPQRQQRRYPQRRLLKLRSPEGECL